MGASRLPEPDLLPRGREGRPLRRLGAAGALLRRVEGCVPIAARCPGRGAVTVSAALLAVTLAAAASLEPIQQIDAGVLNVGYADVGPRGGTPVLLLHGWPYDIHSYEQV